MPAIDIDWPHVLVVTILLGLTWLAIRAVAAVQRRVVRRHPVDVADNLAARRVQTQARVLGRLAQFTIALVGVSLALMTFPAVRQLGTTLLASAGIIGLVAGIAACAKDEGAIAAPVPADAGNESGTVAAATPSKPAGVLPSGTQRGEGLPYEIAGTEVWTVPDPVSGRDYQVFVSLPASYAERPDHRYPVLYVTDADYAFPVVRNIARRLNGDGPAIEDFILIGLHQAPRIIVLRCAVHARIAVRQ